MLYKYLTTCRALGLLNSCKIWLSQPDALNDPYECEPAVKLESILNLPVDSDSNLQELVEDISGSRYWISVFSDESAYDSFVSAYKMFPRLVLNLLVWRRNQERNVDLEICAHEELKKIIRLNARVFSASKCWDSLLMWAHYADEHRGVVIGFDENTIFEHNSLENPEWRRVCYSKKRLILDIADPEFVQKFLTEKPVAWRYEREYRLIYPIRYLEKSEHRDRSNPEGSLLGISPRAIKEIYLGSRTAEETRIGILALAEDKFDNARVFNTKIATESYKLNKHLLSL